MEKILMLGTGHGGTIELYNTCFIIQNDKGNFLIDSGGSIEIIKRMRHFNIELKDIKNIFISHSHTDHILGLIWMLKKLGVASINGKIKEKVNIYCNDIVFTAINEVSKQVIPEKILNGALKFVDFHILKNDGLKNINGINYTFFDINSRGTKQFGFECKINNKKLIFLGDETLNPNLYDRVKDADYVMHEAFCLDSEEYIFHAYQKNHSTVKSVSEIMNNLNVKNLILYHTEDSHGDSRKDLYTKESINYFNGNVIVPNDLEIIEIN